MKQIPFIAEIISGTKFPRIPAYLGEYVDILLDLAALQKNQCEFTQSNLCEFTQTMIFKILAICVLNETNGETSSFS